MRRTIAYICLLLICFVSGAKEITILPQFAVGDTFKVPNDGAGDNVS